VCRRCHFILKKARQDDMTVSGHTRSTAATYLSLPLPPQYRHASAAHEHIIFRQGTIPRARKMILILFSMLLAAEIKALYERP